MCAGLNCSASRGTIQGPGHRHPIAMLYRPPGRTAGVVDVGPLLALALLHPGGAVAIDVGAPAGSSGQRLSVVAIAPEGLLHSVRKVWLARPGWRSLHRYQMTGSPEA